MDTRVDALSPGHADDWWLPSDVTTGYHYAWSVYQHAKRRNMHTILHEPNLTSGRLRYRSSTRTVALALVGVTAATRGGRSRNALMLTGGGIGRPGGVRG
jgi:hypothetical protein